jgi:anti-sigma factor RsiW
LHRSVVTELRPLATDRPEGASMSNRTLSCREVADFLMAYEDGELSGAERRDFEAHLAECPECVTYLESYREAVALGRRAFADEEGAAAATVPEALVQSVLAARRRQGSC